MTESEDKLHKAFDATPAYAKNPFKHLIAAASGVSLAMHTSKNSLSTLTSVCVQVRRERATHQPSEREHLRPEENRESAIPAHEHDSKDTTPTYYNRCMSA